MAFQKGYTPHNKGIKGYVNGGTFKKGQKPWNFGILGSRNGRWKGNAAGYVALHERMKRRISKPDNCQNCAKITNKLDLSNISYLYLDDVSDWEWLCKGCHNKKDWRNGNRASRIFELRSDGTYGKRYLSPSKK